MKSSFLLSLAIAGLWFAVMVLPGCAGKNEPRALVASAQVAPVTSSPLRDSSPTPVSGIVTKVPGQPGMAGETASTAASADVQNDPSSLPEDSLILPGDINALKEAVEQAQKMYVHPSYNEFDCYTDAEYNRFKEGGTAMNIALEVVNRKEIRAAILTLRSMPAAAMKQEVSKLRRPLRKTWGQLGKISSEGQTDAGQKAELLIANAIADKVLNCCQDPEWTPSPASR